MLLVLVLVLLLPALGSAVQVVAVARQPCHCFRLVVAMAPMQRSAVRKEG